MQFHSMRTTLCFKLLHFYLEKIDLPPIHTVGEKMIPTLKLKVKLCSGNQILGVTWYFSVIFIQKMSDLSK